MTRQLEAAIVGGLGAHRHMACDCGIVVKTQGPHTGRVIGKTGGAIA
jgi:hypothetical protein